MTRGKRVLIFCAAGAALAGAAFGLVSIGRAPSGPADIRVITHGDEVDLAAHVVAGKYTVFDFYAPWCPPCRVIGPALERLAGRRSDLAVRKVDIVDWTMPVAAQYKIVSLPYLVLYDPAGRPMAEGDAAYEALQRIFGRDARELSQALGLDAAPEPAAAGNPGRTSS